MALAARRLIARTRVVNARILILKNRPTIEPQPRARHTRQLHVSSRCLAAKTTASASTKAKKTAKSADKSTSASTPEDAEAHDASASVAHADVAQLSPEQQEVNARIEALSQERGRPLNSHETARIQQDYVVHLVETGQKERLRSLMKADGLSPQMAKEIEEIYDLNEKVEQEELQYAQLTDTLQQAGTDPAVLDPLLDKLALTREDLETGRIVRKAMKDIDADDTKAQDGEEFEREIFEKMQRLRGISESEIIEERRQDQLEELLLDQDPQTRKAIDATITATRLRDISNDERLLQSLQAEGSLFELWKRLGWNDADGKPIKRDLVAWEQLLRLAHPDNRKILLKVRDRDRQFADDFYNQRQMELLEQNKREKPGFWNYEDPGMGEDEVFQQDDLPRAGHQELELKREIKKYARLMVWELPLLSKLAKPFTPPAQDQILRFRYTTYMGQHHPSEHKVVVEFSPSKLDLTQIERSKLIKLAGPRYNPSTDMIKISCESFETAAQNKRYLGDQVEILIKEAKDATDTFADVPFDFRHHKPKPFHQFPDAWKLTSERKATLLAAREKARDMEDARLSAGVLVDGQLYLPGGTDRRDAEMQRAKQARLERDLAPDSQAVLTEREREALMVQRDTRVLTEKMAMVADRKARRPMKRDRAVAKTLAMQRRLGGGPALQTAASMIPEMKTASNGTDATA